MAELPEELEAEKEEMLKQFQELSNAS